MLFQRQTSQGPCPIHKNLKPKSEHTNLGAVAQDDLESRGKSFLVRLRPSVENYGRGPMNDGKDAILKGMGVDLCPNDVSTAKVFSCMVLKGLEGDVNADSSKLPLTSLDCDHLGL